MKPWSWWKAHGAQFRLLHRLALTVFSIPTSPSPKACESASRTFADMYAANRDKLSWNQIHQLTFVEINRPLVARSSQ